MSQHNQSPHAFQDDRLADFTDQALAGSIIEVEANTEDEELLALEETILRLKKAYPPFEISQASVKQMQVRFKARVRRESQETPKPTWKKWFEIQPRSQFAFAMTAMAVMIAFAVFTPQSATGSSASATALNPAGTGAIAVSVVTGLALLFLWWKRRK